KPLYNGFRLRLPIELLTQGQNRVQIAYSQSYSRNGTGIHRFEDRADQRVYLYSHSEPYDANRIFPCFDQPDLKAIYELTVEAPADWAVISNAADREVVNFDGRASWSFQATPPFSTYLFALHAGPYEVWKSDYQGTPLRLFSRKSLKNQVQPKDWFEVTKAGLEFFSTQFGYRYPFYKYDQILVPEFNAGAMENVAAVTFNDYLAFRSKPTQSQLRGRAETILHELAHMWFGNLVTMRWWNGLWLNESFATYAADWALESLSREHPFFRSSAWAQVYRDNPGSELFQDKKWAYWSDQSITTHSIDVPVENTDQAESHFDGITYNKGASALKQLAYFLGEEDFQEGLQRYFQNYAYKNSTVLHFLGALQESSGKKLETWLQEWLESPGANTVEVRFVCGDTKKITEFELLQGNAPHSTRLRTHRTQVALYNQSSQLQSVLSVTYSGEKTAVTEAIGKPCPAWVNPNHGDYDYSVTRIDPRSREFLLKSEGSQSPLAGKVSLLTRDQLWHALWLATLEGTLSGAQFSDLFFRTGIKEADPTLLGSLLRRMYSTSILE
ncbi:MAG: aminopeptidase N, partial [Bdellovibrionales bacterium]|nr:aminopeptidase N [Bdellovibrionales bacterium]